MPQALLKTKYEYHRRLPHYQKDGCALFVTFRAWSKEVLPEPVRDIVMRHCLHDHGKKHQLHAAVVMPDHVHMLLTPLHDKNGQLYSLVEILQSLKSASAHSINRALKRSGPVWQEESLDHVVRGAASFEKFVEYIRQNPVRRELVSKTEDYRWLWLES